jgi:hypothetical protein
MADRSVVPVIMQTTLSKVKIFVSLSEGNCFHALWKETLNNVMYCMLPKSACIVQYQDVTLPYVLGFIL